MDCVNINKHLFCTYNNFLKHYVYSYLNFELLTITFLDIIRQMSAYRSIDLRTKDAILFIPIYFISMVKKTELIDLNHIRAHIPNDYSFLSYLVRFIIDLMFLIGYYFSGKM